MDVSAAYIDMCKQAKEIQEMKGPERWQEGDFYTDDILIKRGEYGVITEEVDDPYPQYNPVWLPRVDQLFEMISLVKYTLDQDHGVWTFGPLSVSRVVKGDSPEKALLFRVMTQHGFEWRDTKWQPFA